MTVRCVFTWTAPRSRPGTAGSGAVSMTEDLFFGEDPHDGGGAANEQFLGNVDDILVLGGALSAETIEDLADVGVAGAGLNPGERLAVWLDFEGDTGGVFTDKFTGDGAQDAEAVNAAMVDAEAGSAARGAQSAVLGVFDAGSPYSSIDIGRSAISGTPLRWQRSSTFPAEGTPMVA